MLLFICVRHHVIIIFDQGLSIIYFSFLFERLCFDRVYFYHLRISVCSYINIQTLNYSLNNMKVFYGFSSVSTEIKNLLYINGKMCTPYRESNCFLSTWNAHAPLFNSQCVRHLCMGNIVEVKLSFVQFI
jgi:hypothetical protein